MKLTKIYSDDCQICQSLGSQAKTITDEKGWEYEEIELEVLARNPSNTKNYVVNYHVDSDSGMIDLPVYLITTDRGEIQASTVVKNLNDVQNLIFSWQSWESSRKQQSHE